MAKTARANQAANGQAQSATEDLRARLDKWLWAARFYKTRSLAQQACEAGKVHIDGGRAKPGHALRTGMLIELVQGVDRREIIIQAISQVRGPAVQAQALYQETAQSIARRQLMAETRRLQGPTGPEGRPDKRARRLIRRFQEQT